MFLKKTENVIPLEFWIAEDYMSNFVYTAHVTALSMKTTGMILAIKGKTCGFHLLFKGRTLVPCFICNKYNIDKTIVYLLNILYSVFWHAGTTRIIWPTARISVAELLSFSPINKWLPNLIKCTFSKIFSWHSNQIPVHECISELI